MANISRERAEKFLDELASAAYELRTKYGIPQKDFICVPSVRIDELVTHPNAFANVTREQV